jgi:hypothetical protein
LAGTSQAFGVERMNVLALTIFFSTLSNHGVEWEGAAAAWLLAFIADVGLVAYLIFRLTGG